jgi:hypothetical protein
MFSLPQEWSVHHITAIFRLHWCKTVQAEVMREECHDILHALLTLLIISRQGLDSLLWLQRSDQALSE